MPKIQSANSGCTLNCEKLTVGGSSFFCDGFRSEGEANLLGARFHDNVFCQQYEFLNDENTAIQAFGVHVERSLFFGPEFKAVGLVNLRTANIGDSIFLTGLSEVASLKLDLRSVRVRILAVNPNN